MEAYLKCIRTATVIVFLMNVILCTLLFLGSG